MSKLPDDPVVCHKTFRSNDGFGFRHEPLKKSEADAILAKVAEREKRREELMPNERAAIDMLFEAYQRLKELGWNDAQYCPKDGSSFVVIEIGSTGIHPCWYDGEWPNGTWWVGEGIDISPSRPVLFKVESPAPQVVDGGEG